MRGLVDTGGASCTGVAPECDGTADAERAAVELEGELLTPLPGC